MKKTREYRAVFFRRAFAMLLALALTFGDLSMGVRAAMDAAEPNVPETTVAAAEAPTEASTEATTEAPTQAATRAPTEAPTEASTEAPTEVPTQATTEAPTEEPTEEATQAPTEETVPDKPMLFSVNEGSTHIDFSSYGTDPLDIYNHLYYANASAYVTRSNGSYEISGENVSTDTKQGQLIVIGNHRKDGEDNTQPSSENIPVSLKGLKMSEFMTIKPVGPDNNQKVVLTVTEASKLGHLFVEDNAKLELILTANLEVDSITLGENTSLTVSGTGTLTVSGTFTSNGKVALNGGIIQAGSGISAKSLSLSNTKIDAKGQAVTATETLSMESSTVENASLFGYDGGSGESVERSLTLLGNNKFNNVNAVGCAADSNLKVSLAGIDTVSSSSATIYYCDYTITYQSESEGVIAPKSGWPVAYRVSAKINSFSDASIQGYHTASGYTAQTTVSLPKDYVQTGYHHLGWNTGNSEGTITEITAPLGNITLTAVLEPGAVTVRLDMGYDPDKYTNDQVGGKYPDRTSTIESKLNQTVPLLVPTRFGYKFTGWEIIEGTNPRMISYAQGTEMSYTVAQGDCVVEGENSVVKMKAKWDPDTFKLNLYLGSHVTENDDLLISIDGGNSFHKFLELIINPTTEGAELETGATPKEDFDIEGRTIKFKDKWSIEYGENVSAYLQRVFTTLPAGTLPILKDDSQAQNFAGWSSDAGAIDGTAVFCYGGENGMLAPGGKALTKYQEDLHKSNVTIRADWGVMSYALSLPNNTMPAGWTLTYTGSDGAVKTINPGETTANVIKVQQGSAVTLSTSSVTPENFSRWGFSQQNGTILIPQEQPYQAGDPLLTYQFAMPAANVTATYGEETWIDIAKSPILFEENVRHNNKTRSGFWYADTIKGMTPLFRENSKTLNGTMADGTTPTSGAYFYQWDFADQFYVTSNGTATQNQLTLVNALTGGVWLENVNLIMRDDYVRDANGSLLGGVDCESSQDDQGLTSQNVADSFKDVDLTDCANIVLDISKQSSYPTTLHFVGKENTVGAIMHNKLQISNYSPLKLEGDGKDSSAVELGTVFGYFKYDVTDITVTEYTKDNLQNDFKYLLYGAHQAGFQVTNAVIRAPHKNVHAGFLMSAEEKASFEGSEVELYSICVFEGVEVINSYLRVHENARFGRIPIQLKESSKVVIDGNLEMNFHHMNDRGDLTDDTDNWLVVKGTFCDISNFSWKNGTLICNNLVLGRTGGVQGGTVITNQITSQAVGFWSYDKENHKYTYDPLNNNRTEKADQNNDNYPFLVYNQNTKEPNTYTFSGGQIYLLGYYRTTDETDKNGKVTKKYDSTVKAQSEGNPVAPFMKLLLDETTGDLKPNPEVDIAAVLTAVEESELTNNECVVLGNSSEDYSTMRFVEISGSAQIYAAGNITFYNDTTVSGGSIYCNGSFGSKGDLTVKGGRIEATVVGNAYNLKTTMEDGTLRWKRTDIQGGMVEAERIGAFEKVSNPEVSSDTVQPKGTVTIAEQAIVGTPKICHDVYINYIFDKALFDNNGAPANKNSLRFTTTWNGDTTFANQGWTNTALTFTPPTVLGGGTGNWNWDSLTGKKLTGITTAGIAQNDRADLPGEKSAYDRVQMKLYAVKQNYDLIFQAGADQITAITSDGATVEKTNTDGKTTASVSAGGQVVLTFADEQMAKDKTVLWYIDGSNIIHSVNPDRSVEGQISFVMPNSDVEVYVTNEMSLDLDIASYTLLQDGFRTEANNPKEREDSTFHYLGNLVIQQGSIKDTDIQFKIESGFGKYQMNVPTTVRETQNKILVDEDFNNTASGSRTVTLTRIYQNGTTTSHGIDLEDGAKARFLLDGAIRICRVRVPEGSDFTLKGKNDDQTKDAIYPIVKGRPESNDWASIGNFYGPAGNITLQNLTILGEESGLNGSLGYSGKTSENTVQYMNCVYKTETNGNGYRGWHDRGYFARNAENVIFDNCDFTLRVSRDWPGFFCDDSQNVTICNDSKIKITHNGAYDNNPASTFYAKIKKSLVIDNATLDLSLRVPGGDPSEMDNRTYRVWLRANRIPPIELKGNATLVLEQHALLKKLKIGGTSTVKVGQEGDGYLLCQDIQVNENATLEAGGIIVSGFYDASKSNPYKELETESDFQSAMAAGQYIHDGKGSPGLMVSGGTVTAKEYITGDVNGKITVNGGTVTAPVIGTTGKLYGYTRYVPKLGEEYIYTYERIPVGMAIDITGGQVNVTANLGGMKSTVKIDGGEVKLGEDAVLGLTDDQQTTLTNYATANNQKPANFGSLTVTGGRVEGAVTGEGDAQKGGSISVPYGTVYVSGSDTGISVYNMTADSGDMTISGVTGKFYDNLYTGNDMVEGQEKLGIYVANLLSAKNLTITNGSVVYANYAYANVPKGEEGQITVTVEEENRAYLYTTDAHGVIGEGNGSHTYNDGTGAGAGNKNVFGTKVVDVHYIIRPGDVFLAKDEGKVSNPNQTALPYYTVVDSSETDQVKYYELQPASCSGYNFLGWYAYDQKNKMLTETEVNRIDKSNSQPVYLGAKWERVPVTFEIQIEVDASEFDPNTMEEVEGGGTTGNNLYKFTETVTIPYGERILGEKGILLSNYTTKTLSIQAVMYGANIIGTEKEGSTVPNTRVSAEMADAFVKNPEKPLILKVPNTNGTTVRNAQITLSQNKNDQGRPSGTNFNISESSSLAGSNKADQVSEYGGITENLGSIQAFADSTQTDDGLIHPTAPGYTFGGWYTDPRCADGTKVTADTRIKDLYDRQTTTLYAKWTPNTYIVRFSAATDQTENNSPERQWVTVGNTAPGVEAETNKFLDYHWTYDTAPSASEDGFWVLQADNSPLYPKALPCAWREGFFFKGWQLSESDGEEHTILNNDELSQKLTEKLEVDNFVSPSSDGSPALTLYAKYRPVEVTYDLKGGEWKDGTPPIAPPDYGDALAGYSKVRDIDSTIPADGYTKLGEATGADSMVYCVVSTTSGYFADNNRYVTGDYREALSRKGYTFQGWKKEGDDTNFYGCTPRFEDIELTAQWTPNKYTLELHVKDGNYGENYVSAFNNPSTSPVEIPDVTVGEEIPSSDKWPAKNAWYAFNPTEETNDKKHRFLLGVTFAGLDPGNSNETSADSVYLKYAEAVTNMFNSKTLFDKGNPFFLPEDSDYRGDLAQAVVTNKAIDAVFSVPDYPTGTTIPMYGVYRERSLVFIETYVDSTGATQSKVMYSSPWNVYSDYPTQYQKKAYGEYTDLTRNGYALVGWFVGSAVIDESMRYTADKYEANLQRWKDNASNEGEGYDINVYTAYVAQQTIDQKLNATAISIAESVGDSAGHTLPGSMQEGTLSYEITDLNGLNLVSKEDMVKHQYDSRWTDTGGGLHTANDTVAIELKLEKAGTATSISPISLTGKGTVYGQAIGKGWGITLTLYHSKVMTAEKTFSPFTVRYTFAKGTPNTLEAQWLEAKVTVKLTPSLYEVEYRAELPETADKLKVTENGFKKVDGENAYSFTDSKAAYDSELLAKTLDLEGYDWGENWSYGTNPEVKLTNLTLADGAEELKDGKITVFAEYEAKTYQLKKEEKVSWAITYGNGAGDTTPTTLRSSPADVKYHSAVTFTPDSGDPQDAAYITLTYTDGTNSRVERLYQHQDKKQENGSYTLPMPAENVTVGYSDVMELYLDNGTIELFPDGFKQEGQNNNRKVSWPGDYRILQCEDNNSDFHETSNVLKLSEDLTKRSDETDAPRSIYLGNLNITSDNSIELKDGCKVNLTQEGKIQAKNILAPEGTTLTVTGAYDASTPGNSMTITLEPDEKHAAIGGSTEAGKNEANGSITLEKVDVSMTLKAPSTASGIGPGMQNSADSYGPVTVTNSQITVKEKASYDGQYTGAWIGGAGVTNVAMQDTILLNSSESNNYGAKAVDGDTVTLTICQIGEATHSVMEPIHAASSLTITGSQIYQQNGHSLGDVSMIGTEDTGTTKITNSTVQIAYVDNGKTNKLFTGKLLIQDAQSDITINGTQIVEVGHGSITIDESGVTQGDQNHSHSSVNYLLLEEKDMPSPAPNLTVKHLGVGKTITVQQPMDAAKTATIGKLDIQDDTKVILDGNLDVTGGASVVGAKTLTVECKTDHCVTYQEGLSGGGNYAQIGGNLTGQKDVMVEGDMTLANVTADCGTNKLGSNGGSAPEEGVEGTAATVTISGGRVTASTVGACGAQNDTFTFVKLEGTPRINGDLVQDHYRLNYVVSGIDVELKDQNNKPLPMVLRTETPYNPDGTPGTVTIHDSIPANPTGEDADQFWCWFVWDKDDTKRLGLLENTDDLPKGLAGRTLLTADSAPYKMSEPANDGTQTLSVYAWLNLSGTASIKSGRLFKSFTDGAGSKTVSTRGAWTVNLESNATFISRRDYQVTFGSALPAGTDLTLTVDGSAYYHYTLEADSNTVKFSQFTRMGTEADMPPAFTDRNEGKEIFLLSADFGELADGTAPVGGDISFSIMDGTTTIGLGDSAKVNYAVTPVTNGVIEANLNTVTVQTPPSGEERRAGKTVYLVGTLSRTDNAAVKVPLNASASLTASDTTVNGQWLSGDTVAFKLGEYGKLTANTGYTFSFKALPEGAYSIAWKLCTGETLNMLNGVCSYTVNSTMDVPGKTPPSLAVTSRAESRVLAVGSAHALTFDCGTNADSFTVMVEKQGIMANFTEIADGRQTIAPTTAPSPVTVEIPADAGTYRVRFSLADDSSNDDVYYSFIVE